MKIRDAKEQYEKTRQSKMAKQEEVKEIQMSWGSAEADFERKLDKAREVLERGSPLALTFARKKKQAFLTPEEMQAQVQRAVDALADVAKESGERRLRQYILTVTLKSTVDIKAAEEDPSDKIPAKKLAAQLRKERALKREQKKGGSESEPSSSSFSPFD